MSTPDLLANLKNGAWLDQQTFPPLHYMVPGILPEGMTLFVGPPKVGKSWFLLAVALAVATGGKALGRLDVQQRPVLLLALEDGHRRMQDRCRTLLDREPIPAALNYMTTIQPGTVEATIKAWLERQAGREPLVILDTLGKVQPPAMQGETTYQRDYKVGGRLKALADAIPGSSVIVNHHTRKATSDDFLDSVSGTQGLAGAADTIVVLSRKRQEDVGTLKVTGRDVFEDEYALTVTNGYWALNGADLAEAAQNAAAAKVTDGVGEDMTEVISVVGKASNPIGPSDVAKALGWKKQVGDKTVWDTAKAGVYLGRAVDSGRLLKLGRGQYATTPSVESVESVESDLGYTNSTHSTDSTPDLCSGCGQPLLLRVVGRDLCERCRLAQKGEPA